MGKSLGENCSVNIFAHCAFCGANLSYVTAVGGTGIWLGLAGSELEQMDSPTHPPVPAVGDCGSKHHHCVRVSLAPKPWCVFYRLPGTRWML